MTYEEFRDRVRFLFSDTATSNMIFRESLVARPGNIIDGSNRIFILLNRRVATIASIYDGDMTVVPDTAYTLDPVSGRLLFAVGPARPHFVDYSWYKLSDLEMLEAIRLAATSGGFSLADIPESMADFATHYAVSYCFTAAASRAAEYYTMSASGKHVAKSELYNHYVALAESFASSALKLRNDYYTGRGTRDIPAEADSRSDFATPYFPSDGGI